MLDLVLCLSLVGAYCPQADVSLPGVTAQGLRRAVLPKAAVSVDPRDHQVTRVVFKLAEGSQASMRAGQLAVPTVAAVLGPRAVRPLFVGLERELAHLRARVLARTPADATPPADLALYFEAEAADLDDCRQLVAALNALPIVELAYPKELPVPPPGDIPPLTPSFVAQQVYHAVAPNGVDAGAIQQLAGAWGKGITVLDIEWGWWFDHEDLAVLRPSSLVGPPISNNSFNEHGVAVVGELAGDPDAFGVSGLVPDIRMLCATDFPASGYGVAQAIIVGLPFLVPGDVVLLEAQANTPLGLGPTEWVQADFDAIQNATVAGIFTVEAAGNGGVNLDDARLNRAFDLTFRDSGAIIVGATNGSALTRASFSCYGSRIDANGWGGGVVSTGYGDLFFPVGDRKQAYTTVFNGTSSASPIVTSAVVALLGAARTQWDPALAAQVNHVTIRNWLRSHGTSVATISRRPDLAATFAAAALERGLRLLDQVKIGQSFRVQITPQFAASSSDAWALGVAIDQANQGVPGLAVGCDRLLLDSATLATVGAGTLASSPVVLSFAVPNDPALKLARAYLQAITHDVGSGALCLANSALLWVQP